MTRGRLSTKLRLLLALLLGACGGGDDDSGDDGRDRSHGRLGVVVLGPGTG